MLMSLYEVLFNVLVVLVTVPLPILVVLWIIKAVRGSKSEEENLAELSSIVKEIHEGQKETNRLLREHLADDESDKEWRCSPGILPEGERMAVVLKSQMAIQSSRLRGGPVGSKIKMLLRLTVGLVALTSLGQQALGCTCLPPGSPSEELERSTAVFSGRVVGIEVPSGRTMSSADPVEVTFKVYAVWKGPKSDTVTVTTARSSVSCGYEFETGRAYVVYARGEADDLQVSLCSRTKPLTRAGDDLAALGRGDGAGIWAMLQAYKYRVMTAVLVVVALGVGVRALLIRQ
jgi:hypothetical protein